MEDVKLYRAYWVKDGEKVYIRGGKFYKTIGQCKTGLRHNAWDYPINVPIEIHIEEYDVVKHCEPQTAVLTRTSSWTNEVIYRRSEC